MHVPFKWPVGSQRIHNGRRVMFMGHLGRGILNIQDVELNGPYQIEDPATGQWIAPTVQWAIAEIASGRLRGLLPEMRRRDGSFRQLGEAEAAECARKDRKFVWRHQWAMAASRQALASTDEVYAKFISTHARILTSERFKAPGASTLRTWVRALEAMGSSVAIFKSDAGRKKGQSQLPQAEDDLVQEIAELFWATKEWPFIADADAVMGERWDAMKARGVEGLSPSCPCYETLRLRVNGLKTYKTVEAKFGKHLAERLFGEVGTNEPLDRPGQLVEMDGVEFEPAATFGRDLPIAAAKMRGIFLVDRFASFVFAGPKSACFPGPYREEMGVAALIAMMCPPEHLTPEDIAEEPWAQLCYLVPEAIRPDNDLSLVSPGYAPALMEIGPEFQLPEAYDPDARSQDENFHKWLKGRMKGLPGTIQGRRPNRDPRRDPLKEAEISIAQLRVIVMALVWEWNTTKRSWLGDRSPMDVMKEHLRTRGVEIEDAQRPRRMLAKSHAKPRVLTDDGIEFDGIVYRSKAITTILRYNAQATPHSERVETTAKALVHVRTYEDDLHRILVWDEHRQIFEAFDSTEPEYTSCLSRWEHHEYRRLARERGEHQDTVGQRRRSRAKTLATIAENVPGLKFRQRAGYAALQDSEEMRSLRGARGAPPPLALPEDIGPILSTGALQATGTTPPPTHGRKRVRRETEPEESSWAAEQAGQEPTQPDPGRSTDPGGGKSSGWRDLPDQVDPENDDYDDYIDEEDD